MGPSPSQELRDQLVEREATEGLESLLIELTARDPERAARVDPSNPARVRRALEKVLSGTQKLEIKLPPFKQVKIGLDPDKSQIDDLIAQRTHEMLHNGWIAEVKRLSIEGYLSSDPAFRAIGYRDVYRHINKELEWDVLVSNMCLQPSSTRKGKKLG